ncbi:MAG: hypothetical protein ACE5HK_06300, partial [Candidatus Methylomirabilales bacterium]
MPDRPDTTPTHRSLPESPLVLSTVALGLRTLSFLQVHPPSSDSDRTGSLLSLFGHNAFTALGDAQVVEPCLRLTRSLPGGA